MYETKIPGTRYVCALENVKGQWMIQMRLGNNVESQTVVKDLSERGIRDNIRTVCSEVNLHLNDFLMNQIVTTITEQAKILLKEVVATTAQTTSPEISAALESTVEKLEGRITLLEERVKRLESVLDHQS